MPKNRVRLAAAALLTTSVLLTGCGLFDSGEASKEIDPPQDISYMEDSEELNQEAEVTDQKNKQENLKEGESTESVKRVLYLIDKNGMVVPQTFELPETKEVAKQVMEYLVVDGPISNLLPNGFRAVLPQGTVVQGVNIKEDGTAIVDFSKEFTEYKPEDEQKILQAITWTLTQFDTINKVKIWVNGHELKEMPVNGTPIDEGVSRQDGINMASSSVVDITNTHPLTVYYLAEQEGKIYYVPVTKRVSNEEKDDVAAAVNELIKGPELTTGLLNEFQPGVKLLEDPIYENGQVTLNFNEAIYSSFEEEKKIISNNILNALVLTVTEQPGVESVVLQVNGKQDLIDENGRQLTEPVTRPVNVNTGSF
ncbi:GerMN domain-containing protein [Bacillus alveayuensis]|jgi:germination protein M|uniref:Germination protein M n=1 Tax=Aeribacillus alveayuensis TaxID=279215 RepID=A0ABT9VJX2_9BACI|nr:GerMN domain-containing protein [Bacillus alveayuensis]MDQ0161150.1 germination protein M [Bacillus alveayuensis]